MTARRALNPRDNSITSDQNCHKLLLFQLLRVVDMPRDDIEGYSEEEYSDAFDFIRSACPIGSTAYVDLDDDSPKPFRNGPNAGIIWCGQEPFSLNQQPLDLGHM